MENELAITVGNGIITVEQIKSQVDQVKTLMANVMTEGVEYGRIPGCGDKPTLLQPGAQMINLMFGSSEDFDVDQRDMGNGHREYVVKCRLLSKNTGEFLGSGMGSCSTMESKYRYRNVSDYEITGDPIPADAKEKKKEYRKQGFGMKKIDGVWEWVRYTDSGKQENPDIADTYNTVLKIACKRALVAATLNTFGVSSLFTQDIEDLPSYMLNIKPMPDKAAADQMDRYNELAAEFSELCDRDRMDVDDAILNAKPVKESGASSLETLTKDQADVAIKQAEAWIEKARQAKKANEEVLAEENFEQPELADEDIDF